MRKLKLQIQTSIDGYIAGPQGEMEWMQWHWDAELNKYVSQLLETVDTIVLGRKLAEGFIPYWTNVSMAPEHPEYLGGQIFTQTPKIVFTKTLASCEWENTVLAKGDLVEEITKLKQAEGGDIYACGGASFVSALIRNNLIDDFHLFINPAAIGKGLPIFYDLEQTLSLKLVRTQAFDCGIVLLHYQL